MPHSYATYNYSAPRLPKGLTFSSTLHPVTTNAITSGLFQSTIDGQGVYNYCREGGTRGTVQGGRDRGGRDKHIKVWLTLGRYWTDCCSTAGL